MVLKTQPDDADWNAGDVPYNVLRRTLLQTLLLVVMDQVL